jgi:hypothetical protein
MHQRAKSEALLACSFALYVCFRRIGADLTGTYLTAWLKPCFDTNRVGLKSGQPRRLPLRKLSLLLWCGRQVRLG